MYRRVTVRILAVAACGWFLAGQAEALSLGRARAVALIGRPLEVAVPVTLDRASTDTPCPGATLYYGDSEVQAPAVRWEPTGPGQGHVRITSTVPVDEPTVTVYVRVGCGDTSTRRYVLLAELPPENEPAVRPPLIATPGVPAAPPAPAPSATSPRRAQASAPAAGPGREARNQPRAAAPAPAPAPASRARRPAPPAPQARLRLEPLDLSVERDPTLRLSAELGVPAATDQQRRNELVALWIALQRSPEQSIEELARLQGVERELQSVRESSRQNAAALNELRTQVAQAQGQRRTASYLVLGLAVLLAALVAWIAWRWQRARELERVGRWFEAQGDSVQSPEPAPVQPPADSAGKRSAAPVPVPAAAAAQPTTSASRSAPAPASAQRRGPASAWGGNSEFHASRGGAMRMVGVEELIDVHDKADFFLSIGETDQALALLEAHVHDQVETGALAWMDLLELYHSRGKRAEFERLRAEFGQRFAAQVPDFEHFDQPTASLESYSRALSRIVALWPSRRVLDVIEESIFRNPGAGGAEPFSLEAYRELVLLYHVARDVSPEEQAAPTTRSGFPDTSLQPLNAPERAEARAPESRAPQEPLGEQERLMIPPKSARLGVDIDLEGLATPETEPPEELPALDFDISTFDPGHHDPDSKK